MQQANVVHPRWNLLHQGASAAAAFWVLVAFTSAATAEETDHSIDFETLRDVAYVERGDDRLHADIYRPKPPGPFPGVLMVHGGAWRAGNKSQMKMHSTKLAARGYSVVAINYRLAPEHKFPTQLEDCEAALRFMRKNAEEYKIDPARIAGFGYSAGGHLVALLGATTTQERPYERMEDKVNTRLQAVVAGGAPCDFRVIPAESRFLTYWLGDTRQKMPEAYVNASPLHFVSQDDPPMFFYHGKKDRLVIHLSPLAMTAALTQAGVPARLHLVEEAGHIAAFLDGDALTKAAEFLDEQLKESD